MKHLVAIAGLVLASLLAAVVSPLSIRARELHQTSSSSCGHKALTYIATSHDSNLPGAGIRCLIVNAGTLKGASSSVPAIVWYGEGWWRDPAIRYRHVGVAFKTSISADLTGYATDIYGNGELAGSAYLGNLTIHVSSGSWPAPNAIDVSAPWDERWTRARSATYTPLPMPTSCGGGFEQYTVRYRGHSGSGLRCVFRIGTSIKMWLGAGKFDGKRYTQLGYRLQHGFGARDLCGPSLGKRCLSFGAGSIKLKQTKTAQGSITKIVASLRNQKLAWTETWRRQLPQDMVQRS